MERRSWQAWGNVANHAVVAAAATGFGVAAFQLTNHLSNNNPTYHALMGSGAPLLSNTDAHVPQDARTPPALRNTGALNMLPNAAVTDPVDAIIPLPSSRCFTTIQLEARLGFLRDKIAEAVASDDFETQSSLARESIKVKTLIHVKKMKADAENRGDIESEGALLGEVRELYNSLQRDERGFDERQTSNANSATPTAAPTESCERSWSWLFSRGGSKRREDGNDAEQVPAADIGDETPQKKPKLAKQALSRRMLESSAQDTGRKRNSRQRQPAKRINSIHGSDVEAATKPTTARDNETLPATGEPHAKLTTEEERKLTTEAEPDNTAALVTAPVDAHSPTSHLPHDDTSSTNSQEPTSEDLMLQGRRFTRDGSVWRVRSSENIGVFYSEEARNIVVEYYSADDTNQGGVDPGDAGCEWVSLSEIKSQATFIDEESPFQPPPWDCVPASAVGGTIDHGGALWAVSRENETLSAVAARVGLTAVALHEANMRRFLLLRPNSVLRARTVLHIPDSGLHMAEAAGAARAPKTA